MAHRGSSSLREMRRTVMSMMGPFVSVSTPYGKLSYFGIIFGRLVCIVYCGLLAFCHLVLANGDRTATDGLQLKHAYWATALYAITCGLHAAGIVVMLVGGRAAKRHQKRHISISHVPSTVIPAVQIYNRYFSSVGYFGRISSKYNLLMMFFQVFEIPAMTFQAYNLSTLEPNYMFSICASIVILADCILVPLLLSRSETLYQRNLWIKWEIFVDYILNVGMQILILLPPFFRFMGNPQGNIADFIWVVKILGSVKFILTTSMTDLVTTILPYVSLHVMLDTLHLNLMDEANHLSISNTGMKKELDQLTPTASAKKSVKVKESKSNLTKVLQTLGLCCSTVWGLGVVYIAVTSPLNGGCNSKISNEACKLIICPWLSDASKCHCLSAIFICAENDSLKRLTSNELFAQIEHTLDTEFNDSLHLLSIISCPIKRSPPSIATLHDIHFLIYYGTEMEDCDTDISLISRLFTVQFRSVPLQVFPRTLQRSPENLQYLIIVNSSISTFPSWTASALPNLVEIWLTSGNLTKFPKSVLNMTSLEVLAISDHNASFIIPDEIGKLSNLHTLRLAGNRITQLPQILSKLPLSVVTLASNDLKIQTDLPWTINQITQWPRTTSRLFTLAHNPICNISSKLNADKACQPDCAPLCDFQFSSNVLCDHECFNKECNFDSTYCLPKEERRF